jgi:hypothetical protein
MENYGPLTPTHSPKGRGSTPSTRRDLRDPYRVAVHTASVANGILAFPLIRFSVTMPV